MGRPSSPGSGSAPAGRTPASGTEGLPLKYGSHGRISALVGATPGGNKRGAGLRSTFAVKKDVARAGGASAAAVAASSTTGINNKATPRMFVLAASTCRLVLGGSRSLQLFFPAKVESTTEKGHSLTAAMFNHVSRTFLTFVDSTIRVRQGGG